MSSKSGAVLVIIVNYNQRAEIGSVLNDLKNRHPIVDMVVVDDGSSDGSAQVAEEAGYLVLRHQVNCGVGAAIRTGIIHGRAHGYQACVIMSANGKMRGEDLARVIEPITSGRADYVTGSRFLKGGASPGLSLFRRFGIPVFSLLAWPILGRLFSDVTCGFRCYRLSLFDDARVDISQEWLSRYELEYYIHYWACRLRLRIEEVPVVIPYDHLTPGRKTKISPISGWWSMVRPLVYLALRIKR